MKHTYNLKKQPEDERDLKFAVEEAVELPDKVDLRDKCPPVFDQGGTGACTSHAGVGAYMILKDIDTVMSRLFLYYQERVLEGTTDEDAGATMRSIGKALNKFGVCGETLWPYVEGDFAKAPGTAATSDAAKRKGVAYKKLSGVTAIKRYIAANMQPVMIGMSVYESFESDAVENTGIVPLPDTDTEELYGGHAVLITGYDNNFGKTHKAGGILSSLIDRLTGSGDDEDGYFIVRNSWGADWGDGGYFYLPYAFVTKGLAYDFWVLR